MQYCEFYIIGVLVFMLNQHINYVTVIEEDAFFKENSMKVTASTRAQTSTRKILKQTSKVLNEPYIQPSLEMAVCDDLLEC